MSALDAKMDELGRRFAARAAEERAGLAAALAADDRETLQARAHKLAGIAPMFGHAEIGEAALALELAAEEGGDVAPVVARLDGLLAALSC